MYVTLSVQSTEQVRKIKVKDEYGPGACVKRQVTPEYAEPYTFQHQEPDSFREMTGDPPCWPPADSKVWRKYGQHEPLLSTETVYRGPTPHIPYFTSDDPSQFARLRMTLDNILPYDATERFKYQILVDHLKLEDALLIADSYSNSRYPYSQTMSSLIELYGQPHKLALQRITDVLSESPVRSGDSRAFRLFALKVRALVGMLEQLGKEGRAELECGSHVTRLLSKLPHSLRAQFKRFINPLQTPIPTLADLAEWLEYEVRIQDDDVYFHHPQQPREPRVDRGKGARPKQRSAAATTTILLGYDPPAKGPEPPNQASHPVSKVGKPKKFCPFCNNLQHYFNQCTDFKKLKTEQKLSWIQTGKRCWRCGRDHPAAQCYLKARCQQCNQVHLEILHEVNASRSRQSDRPAEEAVQPVTYYVDPTWGTSCVLLKMVRVCIYNGKRKLETYAILDDGSERTILLHSAAQELGLQGKREELALRTIRQDIRTVEGHSVSFSIASATDPRKCFRIQRAFTATELGLAKHSHPADALRSGFQALLEAYVRAVHGTAADSTPTAEDYKQVELALLRKVQEDSFPEDFVRLSSHKPVAASSRLLALAPEYDPEAQLIRVGGRLRRCETLSQDILHPVVLDPHHPITKLIIQDCDHQLAHPGSERVFAELRRRFWILRGREAVRKHQYNCPECRRWRSQPVIPKMADLPSSSLRLHRPAFYSTGVDCFGPYLVKMGRRTEKRWGIIFKCLTTHAVYLDLLASMDTDSFLMSLRHFIARRGKPFELLSDQGTNFKGGSSELQEAFNTLSSALKSQLARQQIHFRFNPPQAPHFGGSWEQEIRSIKSALHTILGSQHVTEEVFRTILSEVESIINSKPLGYVSSDIADADPITPNMLLMGRPDSSMPQVVYPEAELLNRCRWRQCQALADQFCIHFIRNYLPSLQLRHKWQQERDELTVGTTVLIVDQQLPRALWPVGKVIQVIPGADGWVRTVQIQVGDKTYTRPVARLIRLPALPSESTA
ncbi:unnamed protein product [Oreochromis niloticus]|nr:unnamed protein product [Mustela putorius furo]